MYLDCQVKREHIEHAKTHLDWQAVSQKEARFTVDDIEMEEDAARKRLADAVAKACVAATSSNDASA